MRRADGRHSLSQRQDRQASAKAPTVQLDARGQAGCAFDLRGGDIDGSNYVNILDYSLLKNSWEPARRATSTATGPRHARLRIMKGNWFVFGDVP